MAHTYSSTAALMADAARHGHNAVTLVKTGAYRRTASGVYVADLSRAPKCAVL